jgi:hypothetical protein
VVNTETPSLNCPTVVLFAYCPKVLSNLAFHLSCCDQDNLCGYFTDKWHNHIRSGTHAADGDGKAVSVYREEREFPAEITEMKHWLNLDIV